MATLYEIDARLGALIDIGGDCYADGETGEILTAEALDALQMERDEKIEACLLAYKNLLSDAKAIGDEIKAQSERKKFIENRAERLKNYVAASLNGQKFATSKVATSWRKSKSLVIDAETQFEEKYLRITTEPNKTAIREALQKGETIPGCALVEKQNMIIK